MSTIQTLFLRVRSSELLLQTAVSFTVRIVAAFATFFVSIILGRQLGAEGAGLYFLAFSIVTVLSAVSRLGLDSTIVRFIGSAAPDASWGVVRSVVRRSVLLTLLLSIPVALSVFLLSNWLADSIFQKPDIANVIRAMSPGIIGISLFTLLAMSLQGLRKVIASVLTLNVFVSLLLILSLLYFSIDSAEVAAWTFSGASLVAAVLGYFLYRRAIPAGSGCMSWSELLRSCLPLWVVVIMSQLTQFSGQFIAGAWVSSEEIAQLAVAQRTALLTSFILMAVNMVVAPRFASMYKKEQFQALEKLALNSVKMMVVFALPVVLCMLIFPEFILSLFGEGFAGGASYLQILAVGQFVNVATGSVGFLLTMSGHEKDFRNTVLISGPLAIGLGFALIPLFGATGSAVATAIAIAMQNLVAVWWVKKRLGFNTLAIWR